MTIGISTASAIELSAGRAFLRRLVVERATVSIASAPPALRLQCQRNGFRRCVAARPGDDRDAPVCLIDNHLNHLRLLRLGERGPSPCSPPGQGLPHGLDLPVDKLPQDDFIQPPSFLNGVTSAVPSPGREAFFCP